jgi:hypothetical protein
MFPLTSCSNCKVAISSLPYLVRHPVVGAASESRTAARVRMRNLDWPKVATGFGVSAEAGGIPRYRNTRPAGNNDLLSTLWREVIPLVGVAMSLSSCST